jgi:hypothetical protein
MENSVSTKSIHRSVCSLVVRIVNSAVGLLHSVLRRKPGTKIMAFG